VEVKEEKVAINSQKIKGLMAFNAKKKANKNKVQEAAYHI